MGALIDAFAQLFLLVCGKMDDIQAIRAATAFIFRGTIFALNKQQMTAFIPAIGMGICRPAALMTAGDDVRADPFAQAVVENEVFAFEFILQPFLLYGISVVDDSSFQVKYIGKPPVEKISAGLFAADAAGAVHDDVAVLVLPEQIGGQGQLLPESIRGDFNGILKMSHFILIVITHIYNDGGGVIRQQIEFHGVDILPFPAHVECGVFDTVGHDLVPHLDLQHPEGSSVIIDGDVQTEALQGGDGVEIIPQVIELRPGNADLGIDAFGSYIYTSEYLFFIEGDIKLIAEFLRVRHGEIPVKREGSAGFRLLVQTFFQLLLGDSVMQYGHFFEILGTQAG